MAKTRAPVLGYMRCPLGCGGRSRVSLSASDLAVVTMDCCKAQLFTRSAQADQLVRDRIDPALSAGPAPAAKPPAAPAPVPVTGNPLETKPEPAPVTGFGGLFSGLLK